MSALQHRLSEFLRLELHHSLGAYRRTRDELRELEKQLDEDRLLPGAPRAEFLASLVSRMREYNHALDERHDASRPPQDESLTPTRHPVVAEFPLSGSSPLRNMESVSSDVTAKQSLLWIGAFYEAVLYTLDHEKWAASPTRELTDFEGALLEPRADMKAPAAEDGEEVDENRARRRARYRGRLDDAITCGVPAAGFATVEAPSENSRMTPADTVATIVGSHLAAKHQQPLAPFVVNALVDAHLALHEAESRLTVPLAERLGLAADGSEGIEEWLRRSIALNTFVWASARVAPWMFAEDDIERSYIVRYYNRAWRNNMPMRAMWISAQISLLALHRRAYAYGLLGEKTAAYKDFHKLQYHVRETSRRLDRASLHVDGTSEFLEGLDALADHHIGELYRSDRDHTSALTHFRRAFDRLQRLKQDHGQLVLVNSRWLVQLQMSLGKSSYELGQHKACLAWYIRTWRSLLDLIAADTAGEVNAHAIDAALEWLDRIVDEPELHKRDVVEYLRPIVEQIQAFRVDPRFTALAGDVVLRLGHLMFVLHLGAYPEEAMDGLGGVSEQPEESDPRRSLALDCVRRAWQLDRNRTLAVSDLLKLHFRAVRDRGRAPEELERALENPIAVQETWPGGANGAESMSRAIEYVLLQQLRLAPEAENADQAIARGLLHSLLTHTDSIEARKSHVHEYLTRRPTSTQLPDRDMGPAIEFICLRRYSSTYPILPRPQAFRSHGGGYFARIHPAGGTGRAFGIAIDPGTSYVECLYRAEFALSDIDMVVVTHDHVDHASSLEPLLALRHEMRMLKANLKPLIVIGNRSVVTRWEAIATYENDQSLSFTAFDAPEEDLRDLERLVSERVEAIGGGSTGGHAARVRITPLSSRLGTTEGHRDLAGNPSFGLMLAVEDGEAARTLAITSDLPAVPEDLEWSPEWEQALRADVLVCHLSTAPLAELRQMAALRTPEHEVLAADVEWINDTWDADEDTAARLTYAYWLEGSRRGESLEATKVSPVGDDERLEAWLVPSFHPYLGGVLRVARDFAGRCSPEGSRRLFVLGELSEELGSFRGRIAWQLNRHVFDQTSCDALTSDIGLRIVLTVSPRGRSAGGLIGAVSVLCSTCELDNDLAPVERYHRPGEIFEVCVKGENEGIFYNCRDHDPARRVGDPIFLEKLERYDVFGR